MVHGVAATDTPISCCSRTYVKSSFIFNQILAGTDCNNKFSSVDHVEQQFTSLSDTGAAKLKTPLRKMHYCASGSEFFCQIFRHCSWNSLPSAVLVLLHLLQYF